MDKKQILQVFAWSLSSLVAIIAFVAWGQGVQWHIFGISSYRLFPLFGLLAFSLMWSHYIVGDVRLIAKVPKQELSKYIAITGWIVLIAILMHPGLLEWQLWRDGLGLPPGSVLRNYVAPGLRWAALLGMLSLLVFLAYELHRKFGTTSWWKYVEYATDAAMVAIFIHGLKLGTQLQHGWLRAVWYFYGITLLLALGYKYYYKFKLAAPK